MTTPDGVESVDEDILSLDVEFCSLILEVGHSNAFNFLAKLIGAAVPAVMVSRAGNDPVGGGKVFQFSAEFWEGGRIVDDKIASEGDEVWVFIPD